MTKEKNYFSKTHPKAIDIWATELGILIPNPVFEIVDTVDTLFQQCLTQTSSQSLISLIWLGVYLVLQFPQSFPG